MRHAHCGKSHAIPPSLYIHGVYFLFFEQLESTGRSVGAQKWFNGTIPIDRTVGNQTTFTLIYEQRAPTVYIHSPSGLVYDQRNITDSINTITLSVPGTAEVIHTKIFFTTTQLIINLQRERLYTLCSTLSCSRASGATASSAHTPPISR